MKLKEVLELTKTTNVAAIAKQIEGISEKPLRAALKAASCEHQSGKKGWNYTGDQPETLEQSIYDFAIPSERKARANVSTNESKNLRTKEPISNTNHGSVNSNERAKEEIEQANGQAAPTKELSIEPTNELITPTNERTNVVRKRSSFDIDVELMKDLKIQAIIHEKNVYEIVENAIRKELVEMKDKGLIK